MFSSESDFNLQPSNQNHFVLFSFHDILDCLTHFQKPKKVDFNIPPSLLHLIGEIPLCVK